ncbi:hypothetical protein MPER_12281, partial [Moniliophthora perniciosa FA553]
MEASSSSQQAKSVAQANVRQFLDLEAAVDRGGYDSEDDEVADGFINDNGDDEGRPVNYHALNRALEVDDHNSLFSDNEILFSEPQDEPTGVDSVAAGQSGLDLDQGTAGVQAIALGLDEDDPNVQTVFLERGLGSQHYCEREVLRFIEGYKKIHPKDNIFSSSQSGSCGSGYVYIQTQDSPRAASALRHCVYIRHSRTLGLNGVYMTVISDPIEIFSALSSSCSIAQSLNAHHDGVEIPQPVRDKPILKAGLWVRLGPIEKPKAKKEDGSESSEPPRKKTKVNPSSAEQEEDVPIGDLPQTDSQASSVPIRSYSCEPEKPKPKGPLYFDDPAFVLGVDGDSVTVLFIPRIHASDMPETQPTKEEFPQRLVFNPLIQSRRPEDVKMAWDPTQYGKKRRQHAVYPDGGLEH